MGQSSSNATEKFLPGTVDIVHEEIYRHARFISEIALLSYEDFLNDLGKLNKLSQQCLDTGEQKIIFAVKKGTDKTVLWKGTVRIACVKIDPETKKVHSYRLLSLVEFLRVLKTLQCQLSAVEQSQSSSSQSQVDKLTASTLLNTVDSITKRDASPSKEANQECCICLERKPEVILPCAHSYCLCCIEQWNVNNKTCPICRETLQSTDDTWVISEVPEAEEISEEIRSSLMKLVDDPSSPM